MGIKKFKPTSAARRLMTVSDFADITKQVKKHPPAERRSDHHDPDEGAAGVPVSVG